MKTSLLQENLNRGVGVVSRAVASHPQLPVLANLLIEAEAGKIKLAATNLEIGISVWLPAKTEQKGKLTVPAKVFFDLVSSLPPTTASLEQVKESLEINCGQVRAKINGLAAAEFPQIPSQKTEQKSGKIQLKKTLLKEAIEQVAFAAGSDEGQPVLTGVKIEIGKGGVRLAATDRYRLSVRTINEFKPEAVKKNLLVPARALLELARGLEFDSAEELIVVPAAEEKQLIFSLPRLELVCRMLEGDFPDFDKIIPRTATTRIEVDAGELKAAIRAAAVFARDSANIIKFSASSAGMVVSANAPQVGENQIRVEVKKTGEDLETAFNARYLLEMLAAVKAKTLLWEGAGSLAPGVFQIPGEAAWRHIIMPVRLAGAE
jgi:DNA polymerase-3 subunit beta